MHVYDSIIAFDKDTVTPPHSSKTGTPSWTPFEEEKAFPATKESVTYAKVFAPENGQTIEGLSSSVEVSAGKWQRLRIELPWGIGDGTVPLRFDPAARPCVLDVATVSLRSRATSELVWRTAPRGGLDALRIGGTCLRIPHHRLLRLFSYAEDPQIYLPSLSGEAFEEPLMFEAWVRFDASAAAMEKAVAALNSVLARDPNVGEAVPLLKSSEPAALNIGSAALVGDDSVSLSVYAASALGYAEDRTLEIPYTLRRWAHLHIALEHGLGTSQLRFDPLVVPGIIDVAGVALKSAVTGDVLWKANGDGGLETLVAGGSAIRIPHPRLARFFSYGEDPQIYLPPLVGPEFDGPLRLELWLKAETGAGAIRLGLTELVTDNARTLSQAQETQRVLQDAARSSVEKEAQTRSLEEALREREEALMQAQKALLHEKTITEEATRSNAEKEGRIHSLEATLRGQANALVQADEARERAKTIAENACRTAAATAVEVRSLREALARTEDAVSKLDAELMLKSEQMATRTEELSEAHEETEAVKRHLEAHRTAVSHAQQRLTSAEGELEDSRRDLLQTQIELATTTNELTEVVAELAELKRQFLKFQKKAEQREAEKHSWSFLRLLDFGRGPRQEPADAPQVEFTEPARTFWLEHPTVASKQGTETTIAGWALSSAGRKIDGIRAVSNGKTFVGQHGFERKDVAATQRNNPDAGLSGFHINAALPVGVHEVSLQRLVKGRWEIFSTFQHEVRLRDPDYAESDIPVRS
ncbi:MAG: hypothetical protein M3Z64_06945 [Verrucomicrobiota bacterium]|nr:hypothetical protein [Verrucomicrobiota bacterium]